MKKTVSILSIVFFTAMTHAEINTHPSTRLKLEQKLISNLAQIQTPYNSETLILKKPGAHSNLWKLLDTNEDGVLSKIEGELSKEVLAKWDEIDINKDKELNTDEFFQVFSQAN